MFYYLFVLIFFYKDLEFDCLNDCYRPFLADLIIDLILSLLATLWTRKWFHLIYIDPIIES